MMMRKLNIEDIYLLSAIADKMNFVFPDPPKTSGKTEEEITELQKKYGAELMTTLFRKMHLAKNEINELIANISGKIVTEMTIAEMKEALSSIMKQDGIFDFFK
jgi:hypothetical protein